MDGTSGVDEWSGKQEQIFVKIEGSQHTPKPYALQLFPFKAVSVSNSPSLLPQSAGRAHYDQMAIDAGPTMGKTLAYLRLAKNMDRTSIPAGGLFILILGLPTVPQMCRAAPTESKATLNTYTYKGTHVVHAA